MVLVEITELFENRERIRTLGTLNIQGFLVPEVGDKIYYKDRTKQFTVIERQFQMLTGSGVDVDLFVECVQPNQKEEKQ